MGTWLLAGTALAAPPANDDFANAIDLPGATGTQTGTDNVDATLEVGEPGTVTYPDTSTSTFNNTVWFKWTSPADGNLTVSTLGSTDTTLPTPGQYDAVLGIYSGSAANALTPLGASPQDTGYEEIMTVAVTAGTTYSIQVAGWNSSVAANILLTWNFALHQADMLTFGPGATISPVVANAATIAWTVPYGTNLVTLAPTFTLSPGATCDRTSGATIPSPNFNDGPVVFTVTAQGSSPIINVYTVTVTLAPPIIFGPTGTGTLAFDALPESSKWTGLSVPGSGATATTPATLDTLVNTLASTGIANTLPTVTADPTAAEAVGGAWNSTALRLTSRATGNAAAAMMATLRNDSGTALNEIDLSFTLSGATPTGEDPGLAGYAVYCSLTGATGSWQRIGIYGTPGTVTASNIPLGSPWLDAAMLYVLWVDDNGNPSGDGWFGIDDVSFTKSTPLANMLTFGPGAVIGAVVANAADIAWTVPGASNVAALAATFTLSYGATCTVDDSPVASGDTFNFTNPVAFTVKSSDLGITNVYTVTVRLANALVWNVAGGGAWDLATSNWNLLPGNTPTTFANFDEVTFNNAAGGTIAITPGMSQLSTTVSAASGTYTFSGGPLAGMGSLTKDGNGQLTITGTAANHTFSGGTVINSGKLYMYDVQSSTGLGTGPVTLNGGVFHLDRFTCTNSVIVNGGSLTLDNGYSSPISGPITLNAPNLNITSYYAKHSLSGAISGPGGFTLSGFYGGGLALSGTNSYEGPTNVTSGTVEFNNINSLPGGALSISLGGATVALNYTGSKSILSLTLNGVAQTVAGTYGSTDSDATFKSGYFAGTGTVQVGDPAFAANITSFGTNVVGSAAVIDAVVGNAAAITWYVPSGTDLASLAPAFVMTSGAMCLERNTGDQPVPGFNAGTVDYSVRSPNLLVTNVYTVTAVVLPTESTLIWNLASGGAWNFTSPNWRGETSGSPTPYFDGVNVLFDNTAGGTIILDGNLSPLSTTVNAASGNYVFSVAVDGGAITTGSLTKNGAGTLVMAKANSYAGGTLIQNGTLQCDWPGDGVSHTTLGSGPVTLNNGTLYLFRTDLANALTVNGGTLLSENGFGNSWDGPITLNTTLPCNVYYTLICTNTISGPGGLTKNNGGPMTLSGTNTYTGPTTVTGGTLQCNNVNALGSGALSISTGGAKVNLNYSGTKTVALLTLGGVAQTTPGTYGSTASGASIQNDTYFAGTGTVTVGSDYDTWAAGYLPADVSNPAADHDGDGMTNQQEYAFGLNPTSGASANPITQQLDKTTGMFQYTRRATPATTKLTYSVLTSSNLVGWTPDAGATESFTTSGEVETVTVTVSPALLTAPRLFVRVAAEPTP